MKDNGYITAHKSKKDKTQCLILQELKHALTTLHKDQSSDSALKLHHIISHYKKKLNDSKKLKKGSAIIDSLDNIHENCYNFLQNIVGPTNSSNTTQLNKIKGMLSEYEHQAALHLVEEQRDHDELEKMHKNANFRKK